MGHCQICQDDGEGAAKGHAALLKFASSSSKVLTAWKGLDGLDPVDVFWVE